MESSPMYLIYKEWKGKLLFGEPVKFAPLLADLHISLPSLAVRRIKQFTLEGRSNLGRFRYSRGAQFEP
jgi:hypothetical protein